MLTGIEWLNCGSTQAQTGDLSLMSSAGLTNFPTKPVDSTCFIDIQYFCCLDVITAAPEWDAESARDMTESELVDGHPWVRAAQV